MNAPARRLFSRMDQSVFGRWWWTVDRIMLVLIIILAVCGVLMVVTASPPVASHINVGEYYFIKRHLLFLPVSMMLMFAVSLCNLRTLWRGATLILLGGAAAMVAVLFIGTEIKGAQRWLSLFGLTVQPSEFVKPAFAIVAAWFIARSKDKPGFPGQKIALGLYLGVVTLLLLQPDFGMTIIVTAIYGALLFLSGISYRLMGILGGVALVGGTAAYFGFDHVHRRVNSFIDPSTGDTYQVDKAMDAFINGGFFGTGPGQGTVKLTLPDAHTDFIFAVGGEEMGLMFSGFLVLVYALILLRGINRIMDSDNMFVVLAASGLLAMFGLQTLVHMGSNVHLIPPKGMTLPLVSYGGSSMFALGMTFGAILSLTRRQMRQGIAKGSSIAKKGIIMQNTGTRKIT